MRGTTCNLRAVETAKLKDALMEVDEDFETVVGGYRGREKLVWVLGFGSVMSVGKKEGNENKERKWFADTFKGLCQVLDLKRWKDVRGILEEMLWNEQLDQAGLRLWDDMELICRKGGK